MTGGAMSISILFVDDDANLLQGIARVLKTEKPDVIFSLCTGADEAMAMLEGKTFDAIVADYRMPGRDGLDLLAAAKEKYPGMKRVLLTGQSETEVYEKASRIADLYMSKPCDTMELVCKINDLIKN
jgi:DNA-binding NarL/FixJ family response regulator